MDRLKLATVKLLENLPSSVNKPNPAEIQTALNNLIDDSVGMRDLSVAVARLQGSMPLSKSVSSHGDVNDNDISPSQIINIFGHKKIKAFSSKIGVDYDVASVSLARILPILIEQKRTCGSFIDGKEVSVEVLSIATRLFSS